jgi:hypothetical protein
VLLAAAILNSLGGLAILIGAWVQARAAYEEHKLRYTTHRDVKVRASPDGELQPSPSWEVDQPTHARKTTVAGRQVSVVQATGQIEGAPLPFWPTPQSVRDHKSTFSGWFGWQLVLVGGALVLAASIIAIIEAVQS